MAISHKQFNSTLIIYLQTEKCLQVLLLNTNCSIQHYSFICKRSNGSRYHYVVPIIQFGSTINEFQVLLFKTNNSIQHFSFVCIQLNDFKYCYLSLTIQLNTGHLLKGQTVLFLTIWFDVNNLFAHSLKVKQFYLILRIPQSSMSGAHTIGSFNVISRTLVSGWGSCPSAETHLVYSTSPADWAAIRWNSFSENFYHCNYQPLHKCSKSYWLPATPKKSTRILIK